MYCFLCVVIVSLVCVGLCLSRFPVYVCIGVLLFWGIGFVLCMGSQVLCGSGFCVFGVVFGVLGCVGGRFFCFLAFGGGYVLWGWLFFGLIFLFG